VTTQGPKVIRTMALSEPALNRNDMTEVSLETSVGAGRSHQRTSRLGQLPVVRILAPGALVGILACGALISVSAARTGSLLPESIRPLPRTLAGPLGTWGPDLHTGGIFAVLLLLFGCYATVAARGARLPAWAVVGVIVGLHVVVLLAPPLFSTDVFSYQAYARIGEIYGANPYLIGPHAIALDPIFPYIGAKWAYIPSSYGPIFTALSYAAARLSVAGSVLAFKGVAMVSSLAVVALVWRAARLRGLDPVRAAALTGLNPLLVLYGVGGGHNDLLMLVPMVAAVDAILRRRERLAGGLGLTAVAIKLTAAVVLPFALVAGGRNAGGVRRRHFAVGVATAAMVVIAASEVVFGAGIWHLAGNVAQSQRQSDWGSIPGAISLKLGLPTVGRIVGDLLAAVFLVISCALLRRVWQGKMDWIAAAGWATAVLLITASSILPWYVAWLLPLVALGRDERLTRAAVVLTGIILAIQLLGYIPHGTPLLG
jgi:uncharacterized membrane protein